MSSYRRAYPAERACDAPARAAWTRDFLGEMMGTKLNPGKYDCIGFAEPDEPMFTLLARDPIAPHLIRLWRYLRAGKADHALPVIEEAIDALRASGKPLLGLNSEKSIEDINCAADMDVWRKANRP